MGLIRNAVTTERISADHKRERGKKKKEKPTTRTVEQNATVVSLGCFPVLQGEFCYLLSSVNII